MSLGGSNPLENLIDDKSEQGDQTELPTEDDWKYAFNPVGTLHRAGREMYTLGDDDTTYAGEVVRQMIESRRFRPEAYTWFGYTKDPNRGVEEVGVPHQSLFLHSAIFGTSGFGKSTVMKNMMLQWIQAEYGVCFIDPKGEDSVDMLRSVPEHRRDDVMWVEPGVADRESAIGFNFFDTYSEPGTAAFKEEAEQVAEQFVDILRVFSRDWTPQMSGTAKAIVEQLVKAEEDYSPMDFYKILDSAAERDAFLDMYGDNMEDISRNYVENFEPAAMQSLINQVEQLVSKPVIREMMAHDESKMSLAEAVEEEKVLLVNISNLSDDMQMVTAAFVRRIWSTIQARADKPDEAKTPYYLVIDEFKDVCKDFDDDPDQLRIAEIISKARSLRMSLMVATQQPSQTPEGIQKDMLKCDNIFTFNAGDYNDAGQLSKGIDGVEGMQILELGKFKMLGNVTIDGEKSDGLLIHTFPEYPHLRDEEAGQDLLQESLDRYGAPRKQEAGDMELYGVERYQDDHAAETVVDSGYEVTPNHVLAALASAQAQPGGTTMQGYDDWVPKAELKAVFDRHMPRVDYEAIETDIVRPLTGKSIQQTEDDTTEYFRLTEIGEETIFTGASSGADGDLALAGLRYLSSLGQQATLPRVDEDTVFFHVEAEPPIKPVEDAETMDEAETLHMALQTSYPEIATHFGDRTVMLDANANPAAHPREFVTSLATAQNRNVVFAVPETWPDDVTAPPASTPPEFAENLLTYNETPAFVKAIDEDDYRTFYTSDNPVSLDGEGYALHQSDTATWKEQGEARDIALVNGDGDALVTFEDLEALQYTVTADDVPYHYLRDEESDELIVKDAEGEVVETYADTDAMMADGYQLIHEPLIPESILPSPYPDPDVDTWMLLVVPEDGSPYLYNADTDADPSPSPEEPSTEPSPEGESPASDTVVDSDADAQTPGDAPAEPDARDGGADETPASETEAATEETEFTWEPTTEADEETDDSESDADAEQGEGDTDGDTDEETDEDLDDPLGGL